MSGDRPRPSVCLAFRRSPLRVPPPYAKSELGQLRRAGELEAAPAFAELGGFALAALGGRERVAALGDLLGELGRAGVRMAVCTKGLVGVARLILEAPSMPAATSV